MRIFLVVEKTSKTYVGAMQSSQLQDFLSTHYAELASQEAKISAQLEAVRGEMERVRKAAEAAGVELHERSQTNPNLRYESRTASIKVPETMKEAALAILDNEAMGLSATEILTRMNKRLRTEYVRSSLSPQLSRLKQDGKIDVFNKRWILPKYLRTIGSHRVLPLTGFEE
jgi:hypothetical protein